MVPLTILVKSAQHDPEAISKAVEWSDSTHFEFLGLGQLVKLIVRELSTAREAVHNWISGVCPSSATGSSTGVTERIL
jgi:hypothetical protein